MTYIVTAIYFFVLGGVSVEAGQKLQHWARWRRVLFVFSWPLVAVVMGCIWVYDGIKGRLK